LGIHALLVHVRGAQYHSESGCTEASNRVHIGVG